MWLLGEIKNIAELEVRLPEIHLVSREVALLGIVPPLHFSVTDATGRSVVLETNRGELEMKENPVGVMTNSPEFEWHLKNLNNYLSLRPVNFEHQTIGSHVIQPFGQGSGTYGLPVGIHHRSVLYAQFIIVEILTRAVLLMKRLMPCFICLTVCRFLKELI